MKDIIVISALIIISVTSTLLGQEPSLFDIIILGMIIYMRFDIKEK